MSFSARISIPCVILSLMAAGCVDTGTNVKTGSEEKPAEVVSVKGAPGNTAQSPAVAEIQNKRQLERELDRDAGEYLKKLSERNVDGALAFVPEAEKAKHQSELWQFFAEYSVESFELISKSVEQKGQAIEAVVKANLIVYQKNVVTPQRKERVTTWTRAGDKWMLKP